MSSLFSLHQQSIVAFVPTTDPERARAFYAGKLGLPIVAEQLPFALVFDAKGITLRVIVVQELSPAQYTVLGWEVPDIAEAVGGLQARGVEFVRYRGMQQDDLGIWTAPGTLDKVAWFRDPDGNTLSLSQHAA